MRERPTGSRSAFARLGRKESLMPTWERRDLVVRTNATGIRALAPTGGTFIEVDRIMPLQNIRHMNNMFLGHFYRYDTGA